MASVSYKKFLEDVQVESKEDITRKYAKSELVEEASEEKNQIEELIDHLERKDAFAVWKCIANAKEGGFSLKKMEDLSVCRKIERKEKGKEGEDVEEGKEAREQKDAKEGEDTKGEKDVIKEDTTAKGGEDTKKGEEANEENEQRWLTILSDPLYIGLNWLSDANQKEDVIKSVLHDSYRLEKLAKYEHHYNRDDYLKRASEGENFAAGVVEQGSSWELHQVMDTKGTGRLVDKDNNGETARGNRNFGESLELLKFAAVKGRKKVSSV